AGNFLSWLGNRLATGLSAMNPQAGNALFQRQLLNTQLQSLMKVPGMTPAKAIAIVSNPELQKQVFGNPTPLGELKAGNVSIPVTAQNGTASLATGGASLPDIMQLGNESARQTAAATKFGEG